MNELKIQNYLSSFKIFTHIRNSTHSNGLFNPHDQTDQKITYRGQKFIFKVGEPIPYVEWENIFDIS